LAAEIYEVINCLSEIGKIVTVFKLSQTKLTEQILQTKTVIEILRCKGGYVFFLQQLPYISHLNFKPTDK